MLHYMSGNDYRRGKRQVSFVVDVEVMDILRAKAARHGMSMTGYLTDLILKDLDREPQPTFPPPVAPTAHGTDWDAIIARGLASRERVGVSVCDAASQGDPLEEIA